MKKRTSDSWYVLQVIAGKETKIEEIISRMDIKKLSPFLPKKKLKIRKKGITKDVISPLYSGYVFIIGEWNIEEAKKILNNSGAIKFIGGINSPGIIKEEEKKLIKSIAETGIAEYSKVIKIGSKINVVSGPLKELKGVIESVDRRKQRVVVKLPLLNSLIKVTLGFEYLQEDQ